MWQAIKNFGKLGAKGAAIVALSVSYTDKGDSAIRTEQSEKWKDHDKLDKTRDEIFLEVRQELKSLKSSLDRVDRRVDFLYQNEIKKQKED